LNKQLQSPYNAFGPGDIQQQYRSEQPLSHKISAEDLIRNYANANFMPQKQASDRLHLLCQSRELNPLVSLSLDANPNQRKQNTNQSYVSSTCSAATSNNNELSNSKLPQQSAQLPKTPLMNVKKTNNNQAA
jgi:hypothetical protein